MQVSRSSLPAQRYDISRRVYIDGRLFREWPMEFSRKIKRIRHKSAPPEMVGAIEVSAGQVKMALITATEAHGSLRRLGESLGIGPKYMSDYRTGYRKVPKALAEHLGFRVTGGKGGSPITYWRQEGKKS